LPGPEDLSGIFLNGKLQGQIYGQNYLGKINYKRKSTLFIKGDIRISTLEFKLVNFT